MPMRSKISASSFISAMLRSRCVFSITLAASATLMLRRPVHAGGDDAAVDLAPPARASAGVSPETTLMILVSVCSLSPGLMRSGE